ncbi:MAG TPA: hypothetical protein VLV50_10675 [Stellaceae bacterium]|nr:hypothetical protein [Stellaceae bacterium]
MEQNATEDPLDTAAQRIAEGVVSRVGAGAAAAAIMAALAFAAALCRGSARIAGSQRRKRRQTPMPAC